MLVRFYWPANLLHGVWSLNRSKSSNHSLGKLSEIHEKVFLLDLSFYRQSGLKCLIVITLSIQIYEKLKFNIYQPNTQYRCLESEAASVSLSWFLQYFISVAIFCSNIFNSSVGHKRFPNRYTDYWFDETTDQCDHIVSTKDIIIDC